MNPKSAYYKYRLKFFKKGSCIFIGHLDLQGIFNKAIKRARLPIAYSAGFNPHQLISFAAPLPLGMAGYGELVDIFLTTLMPTDDIVKTLNAQMPFGMAILDCTYIPEAGKPSAALVHSATYAISFAFDFGINDIIKQVLAKDEIIITKKTKKGLSPADIRPDIHSLKLELESGLGDNKLELDNELDSSPPLSLIAELACGSNKNLKPDVVAKYMLELAKVADKDCNIEYKRLAVHI